MLTPDALSRRGFLRSMAAGVLSCCSCSLFSTSAAQAESSRWCEAEKRFRFGVLSLFSPEQLMVRSEEALLLYLDDVTRMLPPEGLRLRRAGGGLIETSVFGENFRVRCVRVTAPSGADPRFTLEIPPPALHGTIRRQFHGGLRVSAMARSLQPVVSMPVEDAVQSIVAAESPSHAPAEFLKAQAIAARSFLCGASAGHTGFDFCDTTHCQFLREAPLRGSAEEVGARQTRGEVIVVNDRVLGAMYSRSCSGRTSTLVELGLPVGAYPYYKVRCDYCSEHPEQWEREPPSSTLSPQTLGSQTGARTEGGRRAYNRVFGWSAFPSNSYTSTQGKVHGVGVGHGVGMCQRGAVAMAREGSSHREILAHYYPNSAISPR